MISCSYLYCKKECNDDRSEHYSQYDDDTDHFINRALKHANHLQEKQSNILFAGITALDQKQALTFYTKTDSEK